MDTQHVQDKVKSNGKWAASQAKETAAEISERGFDLLTTIQDSVSELLQSGGQTAQRAGRQAAQLAKKYPVQTAIGGLVCGFILGAAIFGSTRRSA